MRLFSTFSGIGGFEVGIQNAARILGSRPDLRDGLEDIQGTVADSSERASRITCVGYSEIDKYASSVYEKQFKGVPNYGDITKINAEELPDFDILVGGFPCQAFSIAGKRRGFDDTRGTLFFDLARILRAKQPRLFVFENVKGLLSHDGGNTFRTIISTITELGYDAQWQVLNSKNHGVPQNRERIYIVGHLRGTRRPEVFPIPTANGENKVEPSSKGRIVDLTRREYAGYKDRKDDRAGTLDANYYKGIANQERPGVAVGTLRTHKDGNGFREMKSGIAPTIPARAREDGSGQPVICVQEATKAGYAEATVGDSINLNQPNSKTRRGRVGRGIANTLDTVMQQYTIEPVQLTEARTEEAKAIRRESRKEGKDFSPRRGKELVPRKDNMANTVTASQGKEGFVLTPEVRIRRLTPVERERLQAFEDDWTRYGYDPQHAQPSDRGGYITKETIWDYPLLRHIKKTVRHSEPLVLVSDTQRYKMCGNAVTTSVVEEVFTKIFKSILDEGETL